MALRSSAIGLGLVSLSLLGCANRVAVKEVVADPDAYLSSFSAQSLAPALAKQLPAERKPMAFRRMEFDAEMKETLAERTSNRVLTNTLVYVNAGRGLVRSYDRISNNGVVFRINYKLSYRGFLPLRWQSVFMNAQSADLAQEVKSITRFDTLSSGMTSPSTLQWELMFGSQMQVMNYRSAKDVCTVGARGPANAIHPSLAGDAVELSCDNYGDNGQVSAKATWSYLEKYGVALQRSFTDSQLTYSMVYKAVRIS